LVLVPTSYPDLIEPVIEELGNVAMVIYGNHSVRAAVKAVRGVLSEIHVARGVHPIRDRLATLEEMFALQEDFGRSATAKALSH
jgi:phosphoenolpyruvate phosphomutase